MNNEEKILEMLGTMRSQITGMQTEMKEMHHKIDDLDKKVDNLDQQVKDLKESQEETRENINAILEWTDKISSAVNFPLPRI